MLLPGSHGAGQCWGWREQVLDLDAIANQATRKGFKPSTQYDVGETLAAYDKELDFLVEDREGQMNLIPRNRNLLDTWYVQTTGSRGLPPTLETHTFRIGAKYRATHSVATRLVLQLEPLGTMS
eukprot:gene7815-biopygen5243